MPVTVERLCATGPWRKRRKRRRRCRRKRRRWRRRRWGGVWHH
jgi:hypothetical protein